MCECPMKCSSISMFVNHTVHRLDVSWSPILIQCYNLSWLVHDIQDKITWLASQLPPFSSQLSQALFFIQWRWSLCLSFSKETLLNSLTYFKLLIAVCVLLKVNIRGTCAFGVILCFCYRYVTSSRDQIGVFLRRKWISVFVTVLSAPVKDENGDASPIPSSWLSLYGPRVFLSLSGV